MLTIELQKHQKDKPAETGQKNKVLSKLIMSLERARNIIDLIEKMRVQQKTDEEMGKEAQSQMPS